MKLVIKNNEFRSEKYELLGEFISDLTIKNINWVELDGVDANNFWLIMDDIECYMLKNLKKWGWKYQDYKDYASQWYNKYKVADNVDNKHIIIWKEEE